MKKLFIATAVIATTGLVSCKKDPAPAFTASSTSVAVGDVVTFTDASTDAYNYIWEFGDGTSATDTRNPTHVYEAAGTYNVTLQVTDKKGKTTVVSAATPITVGAPTLSFTASATTLMPGELVSFTNTSSHAFSVRWDFGDGTSSDLVNPTHRYFDNGKFIVSLQATDANGKFYTATQEITVEFTETETYENDKDAMTELISGEWSFDEYTYTYSSESATAAELEGMLEQNSYPKGKFTSKESYTITPVGGLIITDSAGLSPQHTSWEFSYGNVINIGEGGGFHTVVGDASGLEMTNRQYVGGYYEDGEGGFVYVTAIRETKKKFSNK